MKLNNFLKLVGKLRTFLISFVIFLSRKIEHSSQNCAQSCVGGSDSNSLKINYLQKEFPC